MDMDEDEVELESEWPFSNAQQWSVTIRRRIPIVWFNSIFSDSMLFSNDVQKNYMSTHLLT